MDCNRKAEAEYSKHISKLHVITYKQHLIMKVNEDMGLMLNYTLSTLQSILQ